MVEVLQMFKHFSGFPIDAQNWIKTENNQASPPSLKTFLRVQHGQTLKAKAAQEIGHRILRTRILQF
jgi:hypothetical protein